MLGALVSNLIGNVFRLLLNLPRLLRRAPTWVRIELTKPLPARPPRHGGILFGRRRPSLADLSKTVDELAALKPAHVVPSHGPTGDASLIARARAFLQAVQTRVSELKRAGKSADEAVAAVIADIAPAYSEWGNPSGATAVARAAYAEAQ